MRGQHRWGSGGVRGQHRWGPGGVEGAVHTPVGGQSVCVCASMLGRVWGGCGCGGGDAGAGECVWGRYAL